MIRGEAGKSNTVVGICYKSCSQYWEIDKVFFKQRKGVTRSPTLLHTDCHTSTERFWKGPGGPGRESSKCIGRFQQECSH